jgi:hypothetical protein
VRDDHPTPAVPEPANSGPLTPFPAGVAQTDRLRRAVVRLPIAGALRIVRESMQADNVAHGDAAALSVTASRTDKPSPKSSSATPAQPAAQWVPNQSIAFAKSGQYRDR